MFLGLLSDDEKTAFSHLAEKLIEADDIVVGQELDALAVLRSEMGVSTSSSTSDVSVESLARAFTSRRSKVVALLELLGLAYSDASFSLDERSFLAVVAQEMDIDNAELQKIERWVSSHVKHVEAALALMQD